MYIKEGGGGEGGASTQSTPLGFVYIIYCKLTAADLYCLQQLTHLD